MTQTDLLFDLTLGTALKEAGLEAAQDARRDVLCLARAYAKKTALSRPERTATADDAIFGLVRAGISADLLGPASGALFRDGQWVKTSLRVPSARTSNRARELTVWRLK